MTPTETLRAMLDERGVEYDYTDRFSEIPSYQSVIWWFNTADRAEFREYHDGSTQLLIRSSKTNLTPEQAIASTLGRGECHNLKASWPSLFECDECGYSNDDTYCGSEWHFKFCPNCGAKVVD